MFFLFLYIYFVFYKLVIVDVELCTLPCYEVIELKFR